MQTSSIKKSWSYSRLILVLLLLLSLFLTACGYRGPLYLPDESAAPTASENSVTENPGESESGEAEEEEEEPDSR